MALSKPVPLHWRFKVQTEAFSLWKAGLDFFQRETFGLLKKASALASVTAWLHPDIHTYTACDGHIVCFQQLAAVKLHLQQPHPSNPHSWL